MKRDIEASTTVRAPVERARDILLRDPGCVLAERCTAEDRQAHRFHSTLGIDVGGGGGLHHEVVVETGLAELADSHLALPLRWHAATHERLLPTFDGALVLRGQGCRTAVVLRGTYTVPLGVLGRFGDGLAGRRAAHQSLTSFLEQVARRLDAEANRRQESEGWHPAPYTIDLRELGSENYIG